MEETIIQRDTFCDNCSEELPRGSHAYRDKQTDEIVCLNCLNEE